MSLSNENHNKQGDLELAQSDISMNLFMVLMVVLATLTLSTATVTIIGFKIKLSSQALPAKERPLGLARSWAPVLPVSPRLVLRDGMIQRLNLSPFVVKFAVGDAFLPILNNSKHLEDDKDPAAYRIEFTLNSDPVPSEIVAWRISIAEFGRNNDNSPPSEFLEDLKKYEQFDLFIFPGHEKIAWDIAMALYKKRKRYRLIFVRNKNVLGFERSSTRFTFEDMYK